MKHINFKTLTCLTFAMIVFCISDIFSQGNWVPKANFGGTARSGAIGFSIGSLAYVGLGDGFYQDFWEFDPAGNVWTQKANFAGTARNYGAGFSVNDKGYIGLGLSISNNYLPDFWEYNPTTNTWTQKANFAGTGRIWAAGFTIGNKGYIAGGSPSFPRDFWEYNPFTDIWTQKANLISGRVLPIAFSINNKGYFGTGFDSTFTRTNEIWEFNPTTNVWTQKADYPKNLDQAVSFSIGSRGYVCTGAIDSSGGIATQELWAFNPIQNIWLQKANYPGIPRTRAVGFTIANKGYVGLGAASGDFWKYIPDCFNSITAGGPTTFCDGESVILTANAGNNYMWNTGETTQSIVVTISGTYSVSVNGCQEGNSKNVTVKAIPSAPINASGSTTFCSGDGVTLTTNTANGLTYQWLKGGNPISGATDASYFATVGGNYKVIVTRPPGCSTTSTNKVVTVNPLPAASITANGPLSFCAGGSVVFTTSSGTGYTYQWKKNNNNIAGATNISYTATTAGNFKVVVTNSYSCTKISGTKNVTIPCREGYESISEKSVIAFPIPVTGVLNLEIKNFTGKGRIYIWNSSGQKVMEKEIDFDFSGLKNMDMSGLASGLYSVMVKGEKNSEIVNVIKE